MKKRTFALTILFGALLGGCAANRPLVPGAGTTGSSGTGNVATSGSGPAGTTGSAGGGGATGLAGASGAGGAVGAAGGGGVVAAAGVAGAVGAAGEVGAAGAAGVMGTGEACPVGAAGVTSAGGGAPASGAAGSSGRVRGWVNRTPPTLPASWPSGRRDPAMAFDTATAKVVVYGGYSAAFPVRDTWEWDGGAGTWTKRDASPPSTFDMSGVAYDSDRQRMIIFGGEGFAGAGPSSDLWEWDGLCRSWTRRVPTSASSFWPPGQKMPSLAYDPARKKIVLFEWWSSSGTAEWDPAVGTWRDRSVSPSPGQNANAFAWDARRRRGVLFGGAALDETWEWDGVAGRWTPFVVAPDKSPRPRSSAAMAYDSAAGRVMLFGGRASNSESLRDLWEWDGDASVWTQVDPGMLPISPEARDSHGLAYDARRGCLVVYGGAGPVEEFRDVWEWTRP